MGNKQSLCPINSQDPFSANRWCTYQAVDNYTIKVQISYLALLLFTAYLILRSFLKLLRYRFKDRYKNLFGTIYMQVYALVLIWLFCSIARVTLNIVLYYQFMSQDFDSPDVLVVHDDEQSHYNLIVLASVNTFLDYMCSFVLNLLILIIAYQWIKIALLNINENQLLTFSSRKSIQNYFKVLNLVEIYYKYIRLLYLCLLFVQPFFLHYTDIGGCKMSTFNTYYVVIQSSFILLFYIFGAYVAYFMKKNSLIKMNNRDFRNILIQYVLLTIVLIFRIALNVMFKISPFLFYRYEPNQHCSDLNSSNKQKATVYLSLHHFFMHLLPVFVILYIYQPNLQERMKNESLSDQRVDDCLNSEQDSNYYNSYGRVSRQFFRSSFLSGKRKSSKQFTIQLQFQQK